MQSTFTQSKTSVQYSLSDADTTSAQPILYLAQSFIITTLISVKIIPPMQMALVQPLMVNDMGFSVFLR